MSNYVIFLGSLRKESTNRQLAEAFIHHLPEGDTAVVFARLRDVPFYDQDLTSPPGAGRRRELREAVRDADGLVIITPEYNHTAPAVITNAIDWCSRPMGSGVLMGKPSLVMGFTPGPRALVGATAVLRESLETVQAKCVATDYTWGDAYTLLMAATRRTSTRRRHPEQGAGRAGQACRRAARPRRSPRRRRRRGGVGRANPGARGAPRDVRGVLGPRVTPRSPAAGCGGRPAGK